MPVISTIKTQNSIDGRVQGADIDKSAAGIVAGAWASLGDEAVKWGTELLRRQRDDEAHAFKSDALLKSKLSAEADKIDLINRLDPKTGKMFIFDGEGNKVRDETTGSYKLTENSMIDEALEREKARMDGFNDEAPTEVAARAYAQEEKNNVMGRLVKLDAIRHESFMKDKFLHMNEVYGKEVPKLLQHMSGVKMKAALEYIDDMTRTIETDKNLSELQKRDMIDGFGFEQAKGAIEGDITDGNISAALSSINMRKLWRENPNLKDRHENLLKDKDVLKDGESLQIRPDGSWVIFKPDDPFSKNPTKGKAYDPSSRKFVGNIDLQRDIHDMERISVGGDVMGLVDYITPEYQIKTANRLIGIMARNNKVSVAGIHDNGKNLYTALSSTDTGIKRRMSDKGVKDAVLGHLAVIDSHPDMDGNKEKRIIVSGITEGEFKDSMWNSSPKEVQAALETLPVQMGYLASAWGIDVTPEEVSTMSQNTVDRLKNWYGEQHNLAKNNRADFAYSNDSEYKKLADKYVQNPTSIGEARSNNRLLTQMDQRSKATAEGMDVSANDMEKGKFRTQVIEGQAAFLSKLKAKGDAPDGGDNYESLIKQMRFMQAEHRQDLPQFISELEKTGNFGPEVMYAMRMFRDDPKGNEDFRDLMKILSSKMFDSKTGQLESRLKDLSINSVSDFKHKVNTKLKDVSDGYLNTINTTEGVKQANASIGVMQAATAHGIISEGLSFNEAYDNAFNRFFNKTKRQVKFSSGSTAIVNREAYTRNGLNSKTSRALERGSTFYATKEYVKENFDIVKTMEKAPELKRQLDYIVNGLDPQTGQPIEGAPKARSQAQKEQMAWKFLNASKGRWDNTWDDNKERLHSLVRYRDHNGKVQTLDMISKKTGQMWQKNLKEIDSEAAKHFDRPTKDFLKVQAPKGLMDFFKTQGNE